MFSDSQIVMLVLIGILFICEPAKINGQGKQELEVTLEFYSESQAMITLWKEQWVEIEKLGPPKDDANAKKRARRFEPRQIISLSDLDIGVTEKTPEKRQIKLTITDYEDGKSYVIELKIAGEKHRITIPNIDSLRFNKNKGYILAGYKEDPLYEQRDIYLKYLPFIDSALQMKISLGKKDYVFRSWCKPKIHWETAKKWPETELFDLQNKKTGIITLKDYPRQSEFSNGYVVRGRFSSLPYKSNESEISFSREQKLVDPGKPINIKLKKRWSPFVICGGIALLASPMQQLFRKNRDLYEDCVDPEVVLPDCREAGMTPQGFLTDREEFFNRSNSFLTLRNFALGTASFGLICTIPIYTIPGLTLKRIGNKN